MLSYDHDIGRMEILRQFRDKYLLTNTLGQKFVAWHYNNGPIRTFRISYSISVRFIRCLQ